ncbi:class I SAM-dependent methyltransferase [Clostridium tagluense]|uniref:class I SAM-dependent methyltransferase n=1 Tax=Clostridium tagluense TaxID=360422 RepID=UPI001C0D3A7E|nr:class I SAM-dependent methyltransferase [Clostridium tagluense]MBU3128656.1 class I SAM-dependent methyltransferase [Clostridium tagluense]MCB2312773.1 class I SAM-dependent methyltransferase [Clostridium tagluense]MCB2317539.1 class I SAM-dependent methyltransferase [Clostridium tagluense]MCB2322371.1 class I SAM-dependent methyltransferase [Clostridium tagluense]MCB2327374.1 class I SAM-dependent methyltransferase [Clostridium tagluense]
MTTVNYNNISKIYDQVREEELEVVLELLSESEFSKETTILDIGCGTGNYTNIIESITNAKVYGMDASEGMLEKAKEKNSNITFLLGDACSIPSDENYFSLIYMTDVIHHISDIDKMFADISRILKSSGKVCIVTQSHRQIDLRYMSEFFPATAIVDKLRYPDIDQIVSSASKNDLKFIREKTIGEGEEIKLGNHYFELIEKKGYSMLHLISNEDFNTGLQLVRNEMINGNIIRKSAGDTLVWFEKEEK